MPADGSSETSGPNGDPAQQIVPVLRRRLRASSSPRSAPGCVGPLGHHDRLAGYRVVSTAGACRRAVQSFFVFGFFFQLALSSSLNSFGFEMGAALGTFALLGFEKLAKCESTNLPSPPLEPSAAATPGTANSAAIPTVRQTAARRASDALNSLVDVAAKNVQSAATGHGRFPNKKGVRPSGRRPDCSNLCSCGVKRRLSNTRSVSLRKAFAS